MAAARFSSRVVQMFYGPITREQNRNLRQPLEPGVLQMFYGPITREQNRNLRQPLEPELVQNLEDCQLSEAIQTSRASGDNF